jgi:RNA polymerase sigma-70 factor (ECF subfamily)
LRFAPAETHDRDAIVPYLKRFRDVRTWSRCEHAMTLNGSDGRQRFELLYGELYAPISGYVMRRVANPEDAAEAIAETFATLWRRVDSCPAGDEARPWLFGVARRVLANQRRGERRRSELAERLTSHAEPAAATAALAAGFDGRIARAFATLSEADREVVSLLAWEGLTREELSIVLGVSRAVVRLRVHRARRRFTAALAHEARMPAVQPRASLGLSERGDEQ